MAIICEKSESRRAGINGQGEDREKIWLVETINGPPEALADAAIPDIGDSWPAEAEMICISVEARFSHKNEGYIYCEVTAQYSDYREQMLQQPGDMLIQIEMAAGTETIRYAPRVTWNGSAFVYVGAFQTYNTATRYPVGQFGDSGAPAYRPRYALRITKLLDDAMAQAIYEPFYILQGVLNEKLWNGASRGHILFLGGELIKVGRDRWQATMTFVWDAYHHFYRWYPENQQNRTIGTIIESQIYPSADDLKAMYLLSRQASFDDLDIDLSATFPGGLFGT